MSIQHQIQGALIASAVGDALGWITEFENSPADLERKYDVTRITDFVAWSKRVGGRFHGYTDEILPGEYSDDTQLALCTARCITEQGHFDAVRFAEIELPSWLDYARGAGSTVRKAAQAIQRKKATWSSNFFQHTVRRRKVDYRDSGANGAAMRIAPIAFVCPRWSTQAEKDIWANAIVSHGHPRAIWGALLYGYALSTLLTLNNSFEPLAFVEKLASFVKSFSIPGDEPIRVWQNTWDEERGPRKTFYAMFEGTREEAIEHLRRVYKAVRDRSPITGVLADLGCFSPATKGSGLGTVAAGIYFFTVAPNEVEQAITTAVNAVGSDTDSIAAFAGGLTGCLNGVDGIPVRWKNGIQDSSYLVHMGERLASIAEGRSPVPFNPDEHRDTEIAKGANPQFQANERVYHRALGYGRIQAVDHQMTPRDKEVVLVRVIFDRGQSAKFAIRDLDKSPLWIPAQDRLL
jgi:ADP-ribosylglycohydrolase